MSCLPDGNILLMFCYLPEMRIAGRKQELSSICGRKSTKKPTRADRTAVTPSAIHCDAKTLGCAAILLRCDLLSS